MSKQYYIAEIEVENLWHQFSLKTKLNKDLNLFIGINGSGKTTLINIIKGILKVDLYLLSKIDFKKATIKLQNSHNQSKTISFEKNDTDGFKFKISNKPYNFVSSREREYYYKYDMDMRRRAYLNNRQVEELREVFKNLFSFHEISVYRQLDKDKDDFQEEKYGFKTNNPIDKKIELLEQKFIQYKGLINLDINKISENFRKNVFREILTMEPNDNLLGTLKKDIDTKEIELALKNLGLTEKKDKNIIDKFLNKQKVKSNKKDEKNTNEDILFIYIVSNLNKIIKLSNSMEEERKKLEEPINNFISIANSFFNSSKFNKQISIENNSLVLKNQNQDDVALKDLSSGEKQLLILLLETLLQKHANTIYIIDEPEISLHIAWQRALVDSVLKLNSNIQLIIATHSPEIVANYKNNIIRMENIVL